MKIKSYKNTNKRRTNFKKLKFLQTKKGKILSFLGVLFLFLIIYIIWFLPSVDKAGELIFAESTIIYDRGALDSSNNPNDHILYTIHGDENREFIPLEEISPWVKKATIAIEDDQFYSWFHFGFDVGGIIRAFLSELGIGSPRGGSTITQQLVKNTFLNRERSYLRKFNEILLSIKMEMKYSKDEILEMYLNKIPYGHNAYGIEAAAKTFFGKSAKHLTLAESSIIASLPVAPTRFSPYGSNKNLLMGEEKCDYSEANIEEEISTTNDENENSRENSENNKLGNCEYKKGRKDLVLQRMLDTNKISFEEFKDAFNEAKNLDFTKNITSIKAPHFVFYVREELEKKYGKDFLREGGLRIYTTLNPDLQKIAEDTIELKSKYYENTWGAENVALFSVDPSSGEILSYVGGKDYFDETNDGQVDVLNSFRQPGSSFKPLVYTTAFQKNYGAHTLLFDVETDFGAYIPQNFDGKFSGPVTARESLNRSLNIPSIKMAYLAEPKNIGENMEKLGIEYKGDIQTHGIAIGIGVAEIKPLQHINSYQVFANDGYYYEPSSVLEIRNSNGRVLEKLDPDKYKKEVFEPEVASITRHILTDEKTRPTTDGFDWNNLLQLGELDNGAKTGTSNRMVENPDFDEDKPENEEKNPQKIYAPGDSWTIGFTPHLVSGVWVGNNKGKPMKPGATGLAVSAPIWKKFMIDSHNFLEDLDAEKFAEKNYPETKLNEKKINKFTGKIATDETSPKMAVDEVFTSFNTPIDLDDFAKNITKNTKLEDLFHSIFPDRPTWESPVQYWLKDNGRKLNRDYNLDLKNNFNSSSVFENYNRWYESYKKQNISNSNFISTPKNTNSKFNLKITGVYENMKIPINSEFDLFIVPENTNEKVKKVEIYLGQNLISTKNKFPTNVKVSTNDMKPNRYDLKIISYDEKNNSREKNIFIIIDKEKNIINDTIIFGKSNERSDFVRFEILLGKNVGIDYLKLKIEDKNGKEITKKIIENPRLANYLTVPKFNSDDKFTIKVWAKYKNENQEKYIGQK